MSTWVWIVIIAAIVVVVAIIVWLALKARRTQTLKEGFGSEYDRTVEQSGGRRDAERELQERQKRHDELDIRPLSPEARDRYSAQWEDLQSRFVDDPSGAVRDADALVQQVMRERGYPIDDFDQRAADISVDHPDLVERYRTADGIARANERGEASTEDLRHSVRHYRALFQELLVVEREPAEAQR
jgi:type VI protein secretion system component VasK